MKKLSLFLLCLATTLCLSAQSPNIHTPSEIVKIMDDSQISYSLASGNFTPTDFSQKVLRTSYYRIKNDSIYEVKAFEPEGKAKEMFDKAEELFSDYDFTGARKAYQDALALDPNLYVAITYIGETYLYEKDYTSAVIWFEQAIEANYIDYLAHWGLAHACVYTGELKRALKEITITKILDRNNQNINMMFNSIYKLNKVNYTDWYLDPLFAISTDYDEDRDKDVVIIKFHEDWLAYALVYAVWKYEPGYAESMNNNEMLKEKEALFCTYASYNKKQLKKNLPIRMFELAIKEGMLDPYIIYDGFLPYNPSVALILDAKDIEAIADYVINVRSKIKK